MAHLKITPNKTGNPMTPYGMDILLDDKPLHELIGKIYNIKLELNHDDVNRATVAFYVDSVEADAEAMMKLIIMSQKEKDGEHDEER